LFERHENRSITVAALKQHWLFSEQTNADVFNQLLVFYLHTDEFGKGDGPGSINRPALAALDRSARLRRHPDFEIVLLGGRIRIGHEPDHILRQRIRLEAIEDLEQQRSIDRRITPPSGRL
jgi:hypothetical protein